MKLLILSDLHFEFHRDHGVSFVESLPLEVDACVIAGDLTVGAKIPAALDLFCDRYADVVYVHGNHEFYNTQWEEVLALTEHSARKHPNLHWLDCGVAEIQGQRFVGAPLWFRRAPGVPTWGMTDFLVIPRFEEHVYVENQRALKFFDETLKPGDVVVSHHLPSPQSIDFIYKRSPLNAFFLCDVSPLILRAKPSLWIHGHTHASCDYLLEETRVICNPFGYADHDLNSRFREEVFEFNNRGA